MPDILSIIKNTYGIAQYPIITLNKHDGSELVNFYVEEGKVNIELIEIIGECIKAGFVIEYIDNPTMGDLVP